LLSKCSGELSPDFDDAILELSEAKDRRVSSPSKTLAGKTLPYIWYRKLWYRASTCDCMVWKQCRNHAIEPRLCSPSRKGSRVLRSHGSLSDLVEACSILKLALLMATFRSSESEAPTVCAYTELIFDLVPIKTATIRAYHGRHQLLFGFGIDHLNPSLPCHWCKVLIGPSAMGNRFMQDDLVAMPR
jgi:hypothetical protein